jgi:hypothetical protein
MQETDKFVPDFARVENGALAGRLVANFWQPVALSKDFAPGTMPMGRSCSPTMYAR